MTFAARYPGECPKCDEPIVPGDVVRYRGEDELVHDVCPEPTAIDRDRLCLECFMERSLSGACGC